MAKDKTKRGYEPDEKKKARQAIDPDSFDKKSPSWAFFRCDKESRWCVWRDEHAHFREHVLPKLMELEKMTWREIKQATKSYGNGSMHHPISTNKIIDEAKDRLRKLRIYDDDLFSLRLDGTKRIYGILESGVLYILWYDDKHEICPSS